MDVVDISVRNPVKVVCEEKYTTYEIAVQTTNIAFSLSSSVTRRRFSEFCWLRKQLKDHHPQLKPPELPRKTFFAERFDPEFISIRMKSLEDFLTRCVEERLYFSDSSLHLFIQSDLTCSQIDDYLEGRLSQEEVNDARSRCSTSGKNKDYEDVSEDIENSEADVRVQETEAMAAPEGSLPLRVTPTELEDATSNSSGSVSDSLESDMYLSCAVGPGSIQ
ncbi:sorting nexin-10B-like isoform X2 [Liolophura sinensis]|uniref:sorting nexin-10B-like isoform X2 n=1 Tax=Liolophura sinensis TaxID=3198878 RepID=UPI0031581F5F